MNKAAQHLSINKVPSELSLRENAPLLTGILRGIEREALRVDKDGQFAQTPHPSGLGSALTHPMITTDFSEALLEFITPPTHSMPELFSQLESLHHFTVKKLDNEILWAGSMPCILPAEDEIPVAQYGSSNNGKMKTVYRLGLGKRYGRAMQTVAGVHYNFSLPNAFWAHFHAQENSLLSLEAYKNQRYFGLIRNFRRHYWLLILLFGASPALCGSFIGGRKHDLDTFPGNKALYRPYATSLRMGDLGYQSSAQESLFICYNNINSYTRTLSEAILNTHPNYTDISIKDAEGEYQQLNQGLLQIENEFYSSIRPKRTAKPGETALTALKKRGVEYIEVRCLDINPNSPLGVTESQLRFIDTFLLYCALSDSPSSDLDEFKLILKNQKSIVNRGREPDLQLDHIDLGEISRDEWALGLSEAMRPVAKTLDKAYETNAYSQALSEYTAVLNDLSLSPSAQQLKALEDSEQGYFDLSLAQARANTEALEHAELDSNTFSRLENMALESIEEQSNIESSQTQNFDEFLEKYFKQYNKLR